MLRQSRTPLEPFHHQLWFEHWNCLTPFCYIILYCSNDGDHGLEPPYPLPSASHPTSITTVSTVVQSMTHLLDAQVDVMEALAIIQSLPALPRFTGEGPDI